MATDCCDRRGFGRRRALDDVKAGNPPRCIVLLGGVQSRSGQKDDRGFTTPRNNKSDAELDAIVDCIVQSRIVDLSMTVV